MNLRLKYLNLHATEGEKFALHGKRAGNELLEALGGSSQFSINPPTSFGRAANINNDRKKLGKGKSCKGNHALGNHISSESATGGALLKKVFFEVSSGGVL